MMPRSVRSFVRRSGRITAAQLRAFDDLWPRYGIEFEPVALDLGQAFGRSAERVLDIGFGDGEALVRQAADNPASDFLGIEVHSPGIGRCLLQANELGLANLRVICHDAVEVLQMQLGDEGLDRINILFPDPWPKKRHHKRRLLQSDFMALAAGRLKDRGSLYIATDWADYAAHIDDVAAGCTALSLQERREHDGDRPLDRPPTKFERRGLELGHRICEWRFMRAQLPVGQQPSDSL